MSETEGEVVFPTAPGPAVFPYSVVPGGVRSSRELQDAIQRDPLVAKYYSAFNSGYARAIQLAKNRQAYVSYRIGDRIFWTRHRVTLHAGETLLTDGHSLVRGRCGNRISPTPMSPVSVKEPSDRAMSTPVVDPDPALAGSPLWGSPDAPILLTAWSPATPNPVGPPAYAPTGGFFPPVPPIFVGPGSPGSPGSTSSNPPQSAPSPPIVATPEPSVLVLILAGLTCLAFLLIRLNK